MLSASVSGTTVVFDYGFNSKTVTPDNDTTLTNTATTSPLSISSASSYTCTVTVTVPGVCGVGTGQTCPTKISDPVSLTVTCE